MSLFRDGIALRTQKPGEADRPILHAPSAHRRPTTTGAAR